MRRYLRRNGNNVDINATLRTDLRAEELYPVLIDLATYPEWIGIVGRAVAEVDPPDAVRDAATTGAVRTDAGTTGESSARESSTGVAGDSSAPDDSDEPIEAWSIDLRGQLGPLRRSKRLRMVRTEATINRYVRFDRAELDGRQHSEWVLTADLNERPDGTELTMRLHYGGTMWMPMLDRLLRDEIERSRARLVAYTSSHRASGR